jgi:sulfonate transport system ATP-binding protein
MSAAGAPRASAAAAPALLSVCVRAKRFGAEEVLREIDFELAAGECVALVGASGCGKSSLLRILAGLDRDYTGSVSLAGEPLRGVTRSIGFAFQEPRLFPWLSVAHNVAFDLGPHRHVDPRAAELIARVGLAGHERALPKTLSGGMAQRAALARALYGEPRLLLLDEPFGALDALTRIQLQDALLQLTGAARAGAGTALVCVTHDVDEAVQLADRVLVLGPRPARIAARIDIGLPRPRERGSAQSAERQRRVFEALRAAGAR